MRAVAFVLAAILLTAGAVIAYEQYRPSGRAASQSASSPQGGDPTQELASRLLLPPYLVTQDNASYELRLFPGQLPPDPKIDLPQPAGARLVGSTLRLRNNAPMTFDAVLDVPISTGDVSGFYDRELGKLGWSPAPNRGGPSQGGFVPTNIGASRMYCKGESPPWLSVSVFTPPAVPQDVRVHIDLMNPNPIAANTYAGPCSAQGPVPQMGLSKLPPLRAPDGIVLRPSGGSSGGDRQTSDAVALSKLGAADIAAAFDQQLAAAGWTRTARGAEGPVAWSTWKLPGEGDWRGLLLVNETSADRRSLMVRAEIAQ